eukprot:545233_1
MKLQLLTSAAVAAVLDTASASISKGERNHWSHDLVSPGISFSDQAEDAIEVFMQGDEGGPKKEKKSSTESNDNSKPKSNKASFSEGMCDPDATTPEYEDI